MTTTLLDFDINKPEKRFHDLDALRAFTMFLGIVFHTIVSELIVHPSQIGSSSPNAYTVIMDVINGFHMPAFMLLSGFFTSMTWRRHGVVKLLWNRFKRILLPLMIFLPIVGFLSNLGYYFNPNMGINVAVANNDLVKLQEIFETADINTTSIPGGLSPLQLASKNGNTESVRWLIESGADPAILKDGDTALDLARKEGHEQIELLLESAGAPAASTTDGYVPPPRSIINTLYLWFLWFLCLLVLGFSVITLILERIRVPRLPVWLIHTSLRYVWLIPLTLAFQIFMVKNWGPDIYFGLLVPPYLLGYYAVFFGFGALYFHFSHENTSSFRYWFLEILVALLIVYPISLVVSSSQQVPALALDALNAAYTWLMTFGLIGLFRLVFAKDLKWVRYLSDSSYFLYIFHVPLMLLLSNLLSWFAIPEWLKMIIILAVTMTVLLFIYARLVRYTWLGRWLNGPRQRKVTTENEFS